MKQLLMSLSASLVLWMVACVRPTVVGPDPAVDGGAEPVDAGPPVMSFLSRDGGVVTTARLGDPIAVRVSNVSPGALVRVVAAMEKWVSWGDYLADEHGTVDTAQRAPISGSYEGVDVDGLFWSMDTSPLSYARTADVVFTLTVDGQEAGDATLVRTYGSPGAVRIVPPADVHLVAVLLHPPGPGPFPTMVAFGGSEGGLGSGLGYADDLIREGYAVLAMAYFGEPGLPDDLHDIPLEYFARALSWLRTVPEVDANRLGVMGGSRGGELALLLASHFSAFKAVIADAPSSHVWAGTVPGTNSWTLDGGVLPSVPDSHAEPTMVVGRQGAAYVFTPIFVSDLASASPAALEAARIPIERSAAAVALFAGEDDQLWPSCPMSRQVAQTLQAVGHPVELHCFPGAGHLVNAIGLPTTWSDFSEAGPGLVLAMGGTPAGIAHAGRERERLVRDFLRRSLR